MSFTFQEHNFTVCIVIQIGRKYFLSAWTAHTLPHHTKEKWAEQQTPNKNRNNYTLSLPYVTLVHKSLSLLVKKPKSANKTKTKTKKLSISQQGREVGPDSYISITVNSVWKVITYWQVVYLPHTIFPFKVQQNKNNLLHRSKSWVSPTFTHYPQRGNVLIHSSRVLVEPRYVTLCTWIRVFRLYFAPTDLRHSFASSNRLALRDHSSRKSWNGITYRHSHVSLLGTVSPSPSMHSSLAMHPECCDISPGQVIVSQGRVELATRERCAD